MSEKDTARSPVDESNIIWHQFKKRPTGLPSLYVVMMLFGIAVYAPLLANHNPIAIKTTHGTLYNYFFAGLNTVQDTVSEAIREREQLEQERSTAQSEYNEQREAFTLLTTKLNDTGNAYSKARDASNRLRDRIDAKVEALKNLAGSPDESTLRPTIEAELSSLRAEGEVLQELAKKAGAEQAVIKREIDEQKSKLEANNLALLRTHYALNFKRHAGAMRENLQYMRFMVDDEVDGRIEQLSERYTALFSRLNKESSPSAALLTELDALKAQSSSLLAPDKVRTHLEYRWTFPALAALDWLDRFLMVGYFLLVALFFAGTRVRGTISQKLVSVAAISAIASLGLAQLSADLPARNYKTLFLDNVQAGYSESVAFMAPVPYGTNENRVEEKLQRPSLVADEIGRRSLHVLGTDDYGRDVLSRLIWGARVSLSVGFVAVGLYVLIGVAIGALAGFFGGWVDIIVSRFIEVVICFPSFFLIIAVIAFVGPSIYNIMVVIGLTSWPGIARLTRGEFLRLRNQEFVLAGRAAGVHPISLMFRHILPNALTPVLVAAAFGFASSILTESGLSFLGFGVQEPTPSWGQMLSDSQSNPLLYWWMFLVPGFALFLTVTFYNLAGNTFRDAADPRLRR